MVEQTSFLSNADTFGTLCAYWKERHGDYVECLRAHGKRIAEQRGRVTIDDLREEMALLHLPMPTDIGADDRMLGSVLRACKDLQIVGVEQTRRLEHAKRVGATRSLISVYGIKGAA